MKVFLSHEMSNRTLGEVFAIRQCAMKYLNEKYDELEYIDNFIHHDAPENATPLWHLGRSIQQLAEADAIYFCKESNSKGCEVERLIAKLYNLKVLE